MSKISRRDFLKGSGAAALTLAVAGLAGCSPKEGTTPVATPTPENTAAVGGAEIPVQDQQPDREVCRRLCHLPGRPHR